LLRGKRRLQDSGFSPWHQAWRVSPEGLAYEDSRVGIAVGLAPDGSFRIDDLPPGDYRLVIQVNEQGWRAKSGPLARAMREFTIPSIPGGRTDEPLDLGPVRLDARLILKAGDQAPRFAVTTTDRKTLSLKDYQGKYLLLDFGVSWNEQSRLQVVRLNDVYQRFREDNRFAILSLVLGQDNATTRSFVAEKGESWPQAIVGALSNSVAAAFGVEDCDVPAAILIGPDGKVIARDLKYAEMIEAVRAALKRDEK
jgi:peroxiredoxin